MANDNVTVMARQSLVGYNYSLLGNWPLEPIKPNPDYYTTVLFKRLFGDRVLATSATTTPAAPPATNITEGGDRARAFAFCTSTSVKAAWGAGAGAVSVAMINFDPNETATFAFDSNLGTHHDYMLAPGGNPLVANLPWYAMLGLRNARAYIAWLQRI